MHKKDSLHGPLPGEGEGPGEWARQVLQPIEAKVARQGWRELDVLERAGVNRAALLRLLALAVMEEKGWAERMRNRQAALQRLSRRMETLAGEAEELTKDPFARVQAWAFLGAGGGVLGMKWPKSWWKSPESSVSLCIVGMEFLAKEMREEAKKFGRFLRRFADKKTNVGVLLLLVRVHVSLALRRKALGRFDHLEELARLLADAYEAAGKSSEAGKVSADSLRKQWERRGKGMLRAWIRLHTEPPPERLPGLPGLAPSILQR